MRKYMFKETIYKPFRVTVLLLLILDFLIFNF